MAGKQPARAGIAQHGHIVVARAVLLAYALPVDVVVPARGACEGHDGHEARNAGGCDLVAHGARVGESGHPDLAAGPVRPHLLGRVDIGEGVTAVLARKPFHDAHKRVALHYRAGALDALRPVRTESGRLYDGKAAYEVVVELLGPGAWLAKRGGECEVLGRLSACADAVSGPAHEGGIVDSGGFERKGAPVLHVSGAVGVGAKDNGSPIAAITLHGRTRNLYVGLDQVAFAVLVGVVVGLHKDGEAPDLRGRVRVSFVLNV